MYAPTGIGCSLSYSRYDARGHRIGTSDGIYGIANNNGRWGIQWMSAIFTPVPAIGVRYADAEEAALRRNRDWMLGYSRRDQDILNSTQQFGTRAHLTLSNPRDNARNARQGSPLAGYEVAGVTSRLRVSTLTPRDPRRVDANFEQFAELGGRGGRPVGLHHQLAARPGAALHRGQDARPAGLPALHRRPPAHVRDALADGVDLPGRPMGERRGVGVMMYHDLSNDDPS